MFSPPRKNGKQRAQESEIPNEILNLPHAEHESAIGEDLSLVIHPGVICSGPHCPRKFQFIRGVRYKCTVCERQDYCTSCVGQPDNGHDRSHPLFKCDEPCEFIEARRLDTGEIIFDKTPGAGSDGLLALDGMSLEHVDKRPGEFNEMRLTLRHMPRACSGLSLGAVEHHQDPALLAKVILGKIIKYDYKGCQLRDFPGSRPAIARLLELKPGSPGDKVECQFRLSRLGEELPYDVVCCKWRDLTIRPQQESASNPLGTNRKHAVYIGDSHFVEVSTAVFETLQAFRDPTETKMLWIDEICIDNHLEKRYQNRGRSLIMHWASQVIMWAGEGDDEIEDAFALIVQLAHHCSDNDASLPIPALVGFESGLPPLESVEWQSFFRFFRRDTVFAKGAFEDMCWAKNPVLQCGEYKFDWWDVAGILKMLAQDAWSAHLVD